MGYKECDVMMRLQQAAHDMLQFYKEDFLVYKGKTEDSKRLYNEVAAEYVYDNLTMFNQIKTHTRQSSYLTDVYKHYDINQKNHSTPKQIALKLYEQRQFSVGKIVDVQTPLFNDEHDKQLGKIDALLKSEHDELFILIIKRRDTQQSLLRFLVEGMMTMRLIDQPKLLADLKLASHTQIHFAPLLFKDSTPYVELYQNRPALYHLMAALNLNFFIIENSYSPFKVKRYHYRDFIQLTMQNNLLHREII